MKRTGTVIIPFIGIIIFIIAMTVWAKISPYTNYTKTTVTLTSLGTGSSSARVDTLWLNRTATSSESGAVPVSLSARNYSGYRTRIKVGPLTSNDSLYIADTATHAGAATGMGLADSIHVVIKKRLGSIVSLVDSQAIGAPVSMSGDGKSFTISFLIGANATDTMILADDIFAIVRVADTMADTAGIRLRYPIESWTYFEEGGARMSPLEHHSSFYDTLITTADSVAGSVNISDTIWFNRNVVPTSGGVPATLNLRPYSGYRLQVVVGPMYGSDTTAAVLGGSGGGLRDSVMLIIKKKLGPIVSLCDSTWYAASTIGRLRTSAITLTKNFLIGSGATDTLACDDLFGILYVSDTASDSAGVKIKYPVSVSAFFKE